MTRVVVTGAAGFIGAHLAHRLSTMGRSVRAADLRPLPTALRIGVQANYADVCDAGAMRTLVEGADVVFHLAAAHLEVHAARERFERVNVEAAAQLVRICAQAGVRRFVHASSVGIYGHVAHPPAAEDAPRAPVSPYERTKLAGEEAVSRAASECALELVVLRPAWVYGAGCARTAKLLRAIRTGRFAFVGAGENLRHPIHIDDVVDAFLLAAKPDVSPGAWIVAGPRFMPLREMIETCARALGVAAPRRRIPRAAAVALARIAQAVTRVAGREPPFSMRSLAFFENDNAFDTSAAERDLGFRARTELEEGIRRTLADRMWVQA